MAHKFKMSTTASTIGLAFVGSTSLVAMVALVYAQKTGVDIGKDFQHSIDTFTLLKLPAPGQPDKRTTVDSSSEKKHSPVPGRMRGGGANLPYNGSRGLHSNSNDTKSVPGAKE